MRRTLGALLTIVLGTLAAAAAQPPAAIEPLRSAGANDIAAGKRIFESQCAWCHGANGAGGTGPTLQTATLHHAANDRSLVDIVRTGIPGTDMPGFTTVLTERTAWQTAAYVRTLGRSAARPGESGGPGRDTSRRAAAHAVVAGRGTTIGPS
jgi:cytochrome c oxidase cbb3-type subunit 3